jgi:hypothetical protein
MSARALASNWLVSLVANLSRGKRISRESNSATPSVLGMARPAAEVSGPRFSRCIWGIRRQDLARLHDLVAALLHALDR